MANEGVQKRLDDIIKWGNLPYMGHAIPPQPIRASHRPLHGHKRDGQQEDEQQECGKVIEKQRPGAEKQLEEPPKTLIEWR